MSPARGHLPHGCHGVREGGRHTVIRAIAYLLKIFVCLIWILGLHDNNVGEQARREGEAGNQLTNQPSKQANKQAYILELGSFAAMRYIRPDKKTMMDG